MQQEQDTCRICSGPGEEGQPLFHPCKCSGTIRYIHQDCLKTWLDHSKKTTCDVCKHPYSFTKVYAADMPDRVPITVLVQKFVEQVIFVILFMLRAVLVAVVWLTCLPYATLLTWRMYFRFGNTLAWLISLHPIKQRPAPPAPDFPLPPRGNITALGDHFREALFKPFIRSLPTEIFTGQIIASLIVLAFLAVFLLREWIQQNARPGVFDDAPVQIDVGVGVQAAPRPQPQPPQLQAGLQPPQVQPQPQARPQPQVQPQPPPARPQLQVQPQPQARPQLQLQPQPQTRPQSQAQIPLQPPPPGRPSASGQHPVGVQSQPSPQVQPPSQVPQQVRVSSEVQLTEQGLHQARLQRLPDLTTQAQGSSQPRQETTGQAIAPGRPLATAQAFSSESSSHPIVGRRHVQDAWKNFEDGEAHSSSSSSSHAQESNRKYRWRGERRSGQPGKRIGKPTFSIRRRTSDLDPTLNDGDPAGRLQAKWLKDARRGSGTIEASSSLYMPNDVPSTSQYSSPSVVPRKQGSNNKGKRKADDADLDDRWVSSAHGQEVPSDASRSSLLPSDDFEFTFQAPDLMPSDLGASAGVPSSEQRIFTNPADDAVAPKPNASDYSHVARSMSPPVAASQTVLVKTKESSVEPDRKKKFKGREKENGFKYSVTPQSSAGSYGSSSEEESARADPSFAQMTWNGTAHLPSAPRRPPLAASVTPSSEQPNVDAPASFATTGDAPLISPSLATYKAPEELALGDTGYFDRGRPPQIEDRDENDADDEEDEDDEARLTDYFVEPKAPVEGGQVQGVHDTDEEDEEEDVREIERRRERPLDNAQENPPAPGAEAVGQEVDDEEREQNLDEDLDGAMEAVGLRGPVSAVFQNATLMFLILNIAIGAGIWLPFTLGKTVALLMLEPRRALQILHLPIRAVRLLTDPTVDAVIYCMRFITLSIMDWCQPIFAPLGIFKTADQLIPVTDSTNWVANVLKFINADRPMPFFKLSPVVPATPIPSPSPFQTATLVWTSMVKSVWSFAGFSSEVPKPASQNPPLSSIANSDIFHYFEEVFAKLGEQVRVAVMAAFNQWTAMVENDGSAERVWAVVLGYSIVGFLAALYLNTFTVGNMRTVGRAVRNAIRQQMIVTKVALFIVVELVLFPFGCGIMLDYSTLPLFPEASVGLRLAFFARAPVTACFYHWLLGTMFMYQFAILLATCREILRPGCMWFIKDPQDPTFHPIRDILDRPTLAQLRKLGLSAIMYGIVIFLGVGMIVSGLDTLLPFLLPLRWKMRDPLSEIPFDLLFVHLILPPTLHYFRPKKPIRKLMTIWWRWSAHQLRLTSYMFGDRDENEEFTPKRTWLHWLSKYTDSPEPPTSLVDGGFCRVPAGDNIAFLRDKPAMVRVTEKGEALTQRGREIMAAQDAEARQAGRNPAEDYKIVYIPSHFIKRVIVFITFFWLTGSLAVFTAVAIPTVVGRAVFRLFTTREFHDGYSLILGFYLVWWSWLVGSLFVKVRIRRQRHASIREAPDGDKKGGSRVRASWLLFLFKRVTVYLSKILWLVFWLGFVLPTLLSIAVDLYLIIPIRALLDPGFTPTIHVLQSWATGLLLAKIIMKAHSRDGTEINAALDTIRRNGWRRPDPWRATIDFIIPAIAGLICMIVAPPLCVFAYSKVFVISMKLEHINRLLYPIIFVVVAGFQFAMSLTGIFNKWTQNIRDKEFLVELRLRNLEQPPIKGKPGAQEVQ